MTYTPTKFMQRELPNKKWLINFACCHYEKYSLTVRHWSLQMLVHWSLLLPWIIILH